MHRRDVPALRRRPLTSPRPSRPGSVALVLAAGCLAGVVACTAVEDADDPVEVAQAVAADWTARIRAGETAGMRGLARRVRREHPDVERVAVVADRLELRIAGAWFCVGEYVDPDRGIATARGRCGDGSD